MDVAKPVSELIKKKILREEERVFFLYQQREWSAML